MSKHTPEPWELSHDYRGDGLVIRMGPHVTEKAIYQAQHRLRWDHGIDAERDPDGFAEAEANARLMTLSPRLLEACKGLLELVREMPAAPPALVKQAERAVEFAEGEDAS